MVLKISVLASGAVLLDGNPIDLDQLDAKLQAAKENQGAVYYYREAAANEPPPQGMAVLQLVVKNKLPISLSSKPDFSDWVDAKGVSHPRAVKSGSIAMPDVAVRQNVEEIFEKARRMAAGAEGPRGLVIVLPDRNYLVLPVLDESLRLDAMAEGLKRMIPPAVKRNIAVIANTVFATQESGAADPAEVGKAIPFLGNLMGFCYIGHAVWIFEGHASARAAGCRDADVLIVDSGMAASLEPGWEDEVSKVMRNANILIQDRASFKLGFARKVGESRDRLEFRN